MTATAGASAPIDVPYPHALERFPILRQSLLSDADNCMLTSAFAVAYERGWTSHDAARGQIVHRTISRSLEIMLEQGESRLPVDVVIDDVLPEVIRQAEVEMQSVDGLGEDFVPIPLRQIAQARISLKAWAMYQHFAIGDMSRRNIERRITTVLAYPNADGEPVWRTLTGKLDLLLIRGDEAVVVDWKDTFGIPPESSISEEGYFQQRFYAMLVFHEYPRIQRVTLREYYPRYGSGKVIDRRTKKPINPVREAPIDRYALPEIEGEMRALVERFDRAHDAGIRLTQRALRENENADPVAAAVSAFKPAPGSHCSYCVRATLCPIFPKARREGRITNREEAEIAAGELNVAEAAANDIRKQLRVWANNHGDTPVKDAKRPRAFGPVVRTRTPRPELRQVRQQVSRGKPLEELYVAEEYVEIGIHSPDEEHPFAKAAREEEEMLLAAEKGNGS